MPTLTDATEELRSLVASDGTLADVVEAGSTAMRALVAGEDAAVATIHPLGFIQVKLATYEEFSLRFHVWPSPGIPPQEPVWRIHRHGWVLRSYVLRGEAVNYEYGIEEDPGGDRRLYRVAYGESTSTLERTDTLISYTQTSMAEYTAPAVYEIPADAFHATVSPSGEPTATFVVVYSEKESSPLVVGDADGDNRFEFHRHRVPPDDLRQVLAQVL